ncbi:MAG: M42 family peptidase [Proteobacteria bacterium]|nr:M42 family peptidase [Pseudomonadota bacterium]
MLNLLKELVFQPGLSGYESPIRDFIIEKIKNFARPKVDPLGNITATIGTGAPRILFASHMDEIGMIVSYIENSGFLRIRKVGMVDDRMLLGRAVEIYGDYGKVPGVIGIRPPHLYASLEDFERTREVPTWDKICVDIGASSRKEAESLGIRVMNPIIFKKDFLVLNQNRCATRGIDDRFGCALLIKLLEEACKEKLNCEITCAWTVQEEIGAIGGEVLASRELWDIMFAVDAYASADVPEVPFHYGPAVLGNGPILRMMDHHSISTPQLAQWVIDLSQKEGIPLQMGPTGGYTDGKHFLSRGIPMLMAAIPIRYLHSLVEMIDLRDLEGLFQLLLTIIRTDKENLRKIAGLMEGKA